MYEFGLHAISVQASTLSKKNMELTEYHISD
jgi:hypothetical protein